MAVALRVSGGAHRSGPYPQKGKREADAMHNWVTRGVQRRGADGRVGDLRNYRSCIGARRCAIHAVMATQWRGEHACGSITVSAQCGGVEERRRRVRLSANRGLVLPLRGSQR